MSEQVGSDAADGAAGVSAPTVGVEADHARPADPVQRELAGVTEAMARARAGVPAPGDAPTVPGEGEVAGLEQAHAALRATLDRVDRGG